ncbi:MAG TPA: TIGR02147 family protein [Bacteriovoracaceae bacterium]|nr:TIGR02147 family protein [Bacteriovoracaceae bacterium]
MNTTVQHPDLDYRQIIKTEYDYRKERNPLYSLRSFARDLNLSPSRLSEVLNNKGDLSSQSIMDIGARLGIAREELLAIKATLDLKKATTAEHKALAQSYLDNYTYQNKFVQLSEDTFRILADWYHFAILSAMELNYYDGSAHFLSRALRLESGIIQQALDRMLEHKMISLNGQKYYPTGEIFSTSNDVESKALKEAHKQNMDLVKLCLDEVKVELRDITSATICIDVDKLPEAKKMIKEFRRGLSRFLESGKKSAVYNINIQLHPLSEIIDENPDY